MPARSTVKPPGPEFVPNPGRPINPFTETTVPDWVKKDEINLSRSTSRASSNTPSVSISPSKIGPRNLPPPYNPDDLPLLPQRLPAPLEPVKPKPVIQPPPPSSRRSPPEIPISSRPSTRKLQKPLPPLVPKKPAVLSVRENQQLSLDSPVPYQRSNLTGTLTPSMMYPPPPRRVGTTPVSPISNVPARSIESFSDDISVLSPALPSKKQVGASENGRGGLLDDDDELVSGMQAWQPLRPA